MELQLEFCSLLETWSSKERRLIVTYSFWFFGPQTLQNSRIVLAYEHNGLFLEFEGDLGLLRNEIKSVGSERQQSAGTLDLYSMQIRASAFEGESVSVTDLLADLLALTGSAMLTWAATSCCATT